MARSISQSESSRPASYEADARREHYRDFYHSAEPFADDGRPRAVVVGNCQAESLRILLSDGLDTVRIPPVHELTRDDCPHLAAILSRVDVMVAQPVRKNYRELPLGTEQLVQQLGAHASCIRIPVLRDNALFPAQAIVRDPDHKLGDPPVVPYHDLRTVMRAASGSIPPWPPSSVAIEASAQASFERLEIRERTHSTIVVSAALRPAAIGSFHTINHPGNSVLRLLADAVLQELNINECSVDPGRELLRSVYAPLDSQVLHSLNIDVAKMASPDNTADADTALELLDSSTWLVNGEKIADELVATSQLQWYRRYPRMIQAALARHREQLEILGW